VILIVNAIVSVIAIADWTLIELRLRLMRVAVLDDGDRAHNHDKGQ
jgi:hypothetical protein